MDRRMASRSYMLVLIVIVGLGGLLAWTLLQPPGTTEEELPSTWEGILERAREEGSITVFLDNSLGVEELLTSQLSLEFTEKFGITVEIRSGHWSGITQALLAERLGGRGRGSVDVVLLGDEAMGRALESRLLFDGAVARLQREYEIEQIFREGVSGIRNQGSVATLWVDQYVLVANTKFIEEKDLPKNLADLIKLVNSDEEDAGIEIPKIEKGKVAFQNPLESDSGAALLMAAVVNDAGVERYSLLPFNKSLEESWADALGFDLEQPPAEEGVQEAQEEIDVEGRVLEALASGEVWIAYSRYDQILVEALEGGMDENIIIYFPDDGSLASGGHSAIPFNAPHKAAALAFLDFLLSDEAQMSFSEKMGKYPSLISIDDANLPPQLRGSSAWIPRDVARRHWIPWPHFQYRIDLLALWRTLAGE